jgi:long-chain acyl-CoA synthetase
MTFLLPHDDTTAESESHPGIPAGAADAATGVGAGIVLPRTVRTLTDLFRWRVTTTPQGNAYRHFDSQAGRWVGVSWSECGIEVARWMRALHGLQLPAGARVAILLPNSPAAVYADLATLGCGFVPVPMHALDNPSSIAYILSDSDASVLIVATLPQWRAIQSAEMPLPALRRVVALDGTDDSGAPSGGPPVCAVSTWLSGVSEEDGGTQLSVSEDDLAALVYTSGTTGRPKGVMLTHGNVLSNIAAALVRVSPHADDVFLSFLPLSHTFERTAGYYLAMAAGSCVAYARSVALLADDLQEQRPTVLVSVPRIFERVLGKLQESLADSAAKARLFEWAQAVGWRRFCARQGLATPGHWQTVFDRAAWPLLDRLAAQPLRDRFGGRLRIAVSGGAPLSHAVARCFLSLGVPVLQGYGMTETSPVVSVNTPEDNDPATVGRPLPGVEVAIGDNQELLVRGPNVMRGYWKRTEDTARAFAGDWLRTGDQAAIEGGRIRIIGRVKEIIVTSTGEKVAPVDLELAITADPLFEQAFVVGEDRPFIACVVVLNRSLWAKLATGLGLDATQTASLGASAARGAALERIKTLTRGFPYYAQPRAVELTLEPWGVENGLMTPTLKLKRLNLASHFAGSIEAIYSRKV